MTKVSVSQFCAASPSLVWEKFGGLSAIAEWHPGITSAPVDGDRRTCVLADGAVVEERILERDDAGRRYRYTITSSPLPLTDYTCEFKVEAQDNGGSMVVWESTFQPAGAPEEAVEAIVRGVYEAGLTALAAKAEA